MDGCYRNGGRGIHSVHDLDVVREGIICAVCGLKNHWTWSALFHMPVSVVIPPNAGLILLFFALVSVFDLNPQYWSFSLRCLYIFLCNMNFYLAAQTMEWSTYPIILCVCLCMCLLVFHLSDCVKRERRVKWYLVPVCHIVCGLFATLCTGPQGHTHYDINSCQLFCQRWNAHWPHARVLCIDACVGVCQCLQFYIILIYTFILHIQINQRCYKTHFWLF